MGRENLKELSIGPTGSSTFVSSTEDASAPLQSNLYPSIMQSSESEIRLQTWIMAKSEPQLLNQEQKMCHN